jgi:arginase
MTIGEESSPLDPHIDRQMDMHTPGTQTMPTRNIRVIGVPLDMGASRRGVDMGPSAMRVAGLEARLEALGHRVTDAGNIRVEVAETRAFGSSNARYLAEIAETCTRTAEAVLTTLEEGKTPLVLGGDHSLAAGSVSGVSHFYRRRGQKIGVIWIDAHSDINTPDTSPSGNVHGMPLAALLGLGPEPLSNIYGYSPKIAPENAVLVGIRDVDANERANIRRAGITAVYTMRDIDERGLRAVMEDAVQAAGRGTAGYHVSLDMDWIDPEDAPGVGTPVRGGATYREAHLAMEILADHDRLLSFEMVEVNPVIDEHNRTADLAVELACSAFGKKIL